MPISETHTAPVCNPWLYSAGSNCHPKPCQLTRCLSGETTEDEPAPSLSCAAPRESGTCGETGLGGTAQAAEQGSAALGEEARIASVERSHIWACLLSWELNPELGAESRAGRSAEDVKSC